MASRMLELAKELTGKRRVEDALATVIKGFIEARISELERKIEFFESKYGMGIKEFYEKLGSEFPLSWEHESDYMDWDLAIAELEDLKEKLKLLEKHEG